MAKYYYNGVLLPEIPADVLAEYPYAYIHKWASGNIDLMVSEKNWYVSGTATRHSSCKEAKYRYNASSDVWELKGKYTSTGDYDLSSATVLWSNHDIPNGSASATDIYFSASKALPEDYSISMLSSTEAETGILGGTAIVDDRTDMSGNIVVDGITSSNGSLTIAFSVPADDFYLVRMYFTHYDTREFRYTLNGKKYTVSVVGTSYNKAESIDFQMYLTKGANIVAFTGGSTTYAPMFDRFDIYKFRYEDELDIKYSIYGSTLTAIADAIRAKKEITTELTPAQMAMEIEGIEVGGALPPVAEGEHFGGTPIEEQYLIQGETLENIAVAIQNKKGTTAFFTPEQMATEIETIITGDNLPLAEYASFGTAEDEVEYGITSGTFGNQVGSTHKLGWEFMPKEDFAVLGFRWAGNAFVTNGYAATLELWDAEKQTQIATLRVTDGEHNVWKEYRLENPINLLAGKTYAVTMQSGGFANMSKVAFNSKLTYLRAINANNGYPATTTSGYFPVDILIGEAITESVINEYKIRHETLTTIADEVKRITGASGTLSTEQIITALQGIAVQTTE